MHNCPPTLKYLSHPGLDKRANNASPVAAQKEQITSRQGDAESREERGRPAEEEEKPERCNEMTVSR